MVRPILVCPSRGLCKKYRLGVGHFDVPAAVAPMRHSGHISLKRLCDTCVARAQTFKRGRAPLNGRSNILSENEEKDIDLQIDIMKAQLRWYWLLNYLVILVGILIAIATALKNHPLLWYVLPALTGLILASWSFWRDWPDKKAKELREKYTRKDDTT